MNRETIQRREFITLLGGAAAVWPISARAQQGGPPRRLGLLAGGADDAYQKANIAALSEGLAKLGWVEGRNLQVEVRFAGGDRDRISAHAVELVRLAPEVIVVSGATLGTIAVQQQTKTIPIVFAEGADPVVGGIVRSLARPEGNTTGFASFEPTVGGKWLEMLKEAAPRITRVAQMFNSALSVTGAMSVFPAYFSAIEAAAPVVGVQTSRTPYSDAIDIVRALDAFAGEPNGGLLLLPPPLPAGIREILIRLAIQHRLPAIYGFRDHAVAGGLISFGSNIADQHRRAASYVDRLLRGAKVSDLPVQFPTKFELVVNLKTAKAIGLTIPESFLLRADEVIE